MQLNERLVQNLLLFLLILIRTSSCYEFEPCLGQQYIEFSTITNNSLAQKHFILGLAFLHNFGYSFAFEQFEKALNIDSEFAMAYVFSSLTNVQPV
jgi:hypothetical protein